MSYRSFERDSMIGINHCDYYQPHSPSYPTFQTKQEEHSLFPFIDFKFLNAEITMTLQTPGIHHNERSLPTTTSKHHHREQG